MVASWVAVLVSQRSSVQVDHTPRNALPLIQGKQGYLAGPVNNKLTLLMPNISNAVSSTIGLGAVVHGPGYQPPMTHGHQWPTHAPPQYQHYRNSAYPPASNVHQYDPQASHRGFEEPNTARTQSRLPLESQLPVTFEPQIYSEHERQVLRGRRSRSPTREERPLRMRSPARSHDRDQGSRAMGTSMPMPTPMFMPSPEPIPIATPRTTAGAEIRRARTENQAPPTKTANYEAAFLESQADLAMVMKRLVAIEEAAECQAKNRTGRVIEPESMTSIHNTFGSFDAIEIEDMDEVWQPKAIRRGERGCRPQPEKEQCRER